MKKIVIAALMLALCMAVAVPALAEGVRDANAAYNELLAGFNGKYPDEYAGAYVDTSDGDKLCVLLTERHADTAAKLGAARIPVPLSTINGRGIIYALKPDRMRIDGADTDALLAISAEPIRGAEAIVPYHIAKESL